MCVVYITIFCLHYPITWPTLAAYSTPPSMIVKESSPDSSVDVGFVPAAPSPSVPWPKFLSQSTSRFSLAPAWCQISDFSGLDPLVMCIVKSCKILLTYGSHLCDFDVQLRWIPEISRENEDQKLASLKLVFSF